MATSPFELFRRNLKPLMIALTVLAMFAFVVLPALESYLQMNRPGGPTQTTVASYEGGSFDINEIDYFNRNHNLTLRFLSALAEKTMERGGIPQVPGFAQDPQSGEIRSLGINTNVSRQAAVTAKLFAEQAEEMGMELDDAALRSWLDRFVDGKLSPAEINGVLVTATDNQLGQFHMYEQLRTHLLASAAQQVVSAGLVGGNQLTTPPAEQFDLFRRLNQQAVITAYPVLVEDFLDKVTGEPSEAEIKELYEDGKERYPDEMSSKPAFRRPATRAFEYVTADMEKLIEAEMKTIPEEELRAEYEQQLEGGAFQLPATPEASTPPSDDPAADPAPGENATDPAADDAPAGEPPVDEQPADEQPADEQPADEQPADEQPADDAGDEGEMQLDEAAPTEAPVEEAPVEEAPVEEAPVEEAPVEEAPVEEAPVEEAPAQEEAADEEPVDEQAEPTGGEEEQTGEVEAAEEPAENDPAESAENAEPNDSARLRRSSNPLRLIAFRPQEEAADPSTDESDEPAETPAQPEASPTEAPEPSEPAEPATDAAEAPTAAEQAAPADEPGAADPEAGQTAAPTENAEPIQDEAEPRTRTFEEVREEIARQLASAPATEKAQAAIRQVNDAMRRYFTRKAIYDAGTSQAAEPPARPDLEAMAEELGLEYVKTEPLNQFELQDHPLGNTATRGMDMRGGERLPNLVFAGSVPIESPIQTESMSNRQPYVSWVIAATDESVPELSEVRDEVVAYWREQQARELAQQAAEDLAAKANESDQPLAELVPEDRKSLVAENIGPFPWMLWLGPGRRPIEWSVQELDRTGEAFMQQVFFQSLDQFGVAPNAPETVYYTVKTIQRTPPTEELRDRFMRSDERRPVIALASEAISEIQQGYFAAFQEEMGLEWAEE